MADAVRRFEDSVCALLVLALFLLLLAQVAGRHVLPRPLSWTEEVARYGMIWLTFIGAAIATRDGTHIAVDSLIVNRSARVIHIAAIIAALALCAIAVTLIPPSYQTVMAARGIPSSSSPMTRMWLFMGPFVGWCLILGHGTWGLWRLITEPARVAHPADEGKS